MKKLFKWICLDEMNHNFKIHEVFRNFLFLFLAAVLCSFSSGLAQKLVQANYQNASIEEVILDLQEQTGCGLVYKQVDLDSDLKVNYFSESASLDEVLTKSFENTDLTYVFRDEVIVVYKGDSSVGTETIIQDKKEIQGFVKDENGLTLPGVSISIKGTTTGTVTDIEGNFTIEVQVNDILVVSFVGLETQEFVVTTADQYNIVLKSSSVDVDEVIVVAYGVSKKSSFTGAAVSVNKEELKKRSVSNIVNALEGVAPGISVADASGQPGSAPDIRIRGFGSINADSDPLYLVDGAIYSGSISDLNASDIESLTILKDANSTALYGARAANGIVMITTKKGQQKKQTFSFNASHGYVSRAIKEYKKVNAYEYYPALWSAYKNSLVEGGYDEDYAAEVASGLSTESSLYDLLGYNPFTVGDDEIVGLDGSLNSNASLLYDDTDWFEPITRTGKRSDYSLSTSGGTDKSDFYFSLGYTKEEGYVISSSMERYTARMNFNNQPTPWLKMGSNISGFMTESEAFDTGDSYSSSYRNPFNFARNMAPIYPIYEHDMTTGDYILDDLGEKVYDFGDNRGASASPGRHIVAEMNWNENVYKKNGISDRTYFEVSFLKDFKFTTNVSLDIKNYNDSEMDNSVVGDAAGDGRVLKERYTRTVYTFNQLLNYNKEFGKHSLDVLLGHENYDYEFEYLDGQKSGEILEGNTELANYTTTTDLDSYTNTYRTEGYFSRLNYNYEDKYYFSGSFRRDGTSRFYEDNRWGNFWSAGLTWRLSEEDWFNNMEWIDMLKLRSSYGEVGNDRVGSYYAWQSLYTIKNNVNDPGFRMDSEIGNSSLEWESNKSSDVALEFSLFNNRLSGTLEYYHKKTDNLLFEVDLPVSSGADSQYQNTGALKNEGFEIFISGVPVLTDDFQWRVDVNMSTVKNEILSMPYDELINGSKKLKVGHSIYDFWLRDFVGVNADNGASIFALDPDEDQTEGYEYDGVMVTEDYNYANYHYCGSAIPDLFGSIKNSFSYKNFDLSFLFTYQIGGKVMDYTYQGLMHGGEMGSALHKDALKAWKSVGDKTDVPKMEYGNSNNNATSDRWLTDASFINLKNVSLSYNFDSSLISSLGLSSLRAYVTGENLWLHNKRTGMNSQEEFNGTQSNDYIPSKSVTFGLNLTF